MERTLEVSGNDHNGGGGYPLIFGETTRTAFYSHFATTFNDDFIAFSTDLQVLEPCGQLESYLAKTYHFNP